MIRLTRINQNPLVLNADLILSVESTPDTLLTLLNGDRVHVRESVDEVIERALAYQRAARETIAVVAVPPPEGI